MSDDIFAAWIDAANRRFRHADILEFYCDKLGFEVVNASPEVHTSEGRFSHWVWLKRGAAEIMLNTQYDSNERPKAKTLGRDDAHADTVFYIGCDDIDDAFHDVAGRGLQVDPPKKTSYGMKTFSARDPDGYLVVFQQIS